MLLLWKKNVCNTFIVGNGKRIPFIDLGKQFLQKQGRVIYVEWMKTVE